MNKYGAKSVTIQGHRFDSIKEKNRWLELRSWEQEKKITHLILKPEFQLIVNKKLVCKYIPDFVYFEKGKKVVEDVKGMKTPVYRLKKKLFEALGYGTIKET